MNTVRSQIACMLKQLLSVNVPDTYRDNFATLPQLGSDEGNQYIIMSLKEIYMSLEFPELKIMGLALHRDMYRAYEHWEDTSEVQ